MFKVIICIFSVCSVYANDVMNFDWSSLSRPTSVLSFENGNNLYKFAFKRRDFEDKFSANNNNYKFIPYIYLHRDKNSDEHNIIQHRNDADVFSLKTDNLREDDDVQLESDFGTFVPRQKYSDRRPKFQTQRNNKTTGKSTFVQKIPKLQENGSYSTRSKINTLLKNYLAKLYLKKYNGINDISGNLTADVVNKIYNNITEYGEYQESKFFDSSLWNLKNKTDTLKNKFLSLFTIVKFPNSQCQTSSSSGTYLGVCYHQTECALMNGTALGNCADGYGVCCVFRDTCGGSSSQNCTYFESPGYPNYDPTGPDVLPPTTAPPVTGNPSPTPDPRLTYPYHLKNKLLRETRQTDTSRSCYFNVYKMNDNIQQMRIDFVDLELRGPTDGTCVDERLIISGQNVNDEIPVICGYNTGQHVYVDVSMLSGTLQLSVLSATGERKRFRIRICQLASQCSNSNNCLQYYTGVTGMISSFNYDQTVVNRSEPGYFNNLNYAICIRKEAGYCSITYTNMPAGVEYPFQFRNVDDAGNPITPPGQAGVEVFNCPDDYIVIGGTRLCGDKFNDGTMIDDFTMNAPVTDNGGGPIVIPVRTDSSLSGRGFKLFYTQNMCT